MRNKLVKDMSNEELGRFIRTAFFNVPNHTKKCINSIGVKKDVEVYGSESDGEDNWALTRLTGKWNIVITLEDEQE